MTELKEMFFDLETKLWSTEVQGGFSNISAFGMSVAVTWNDGHGFQTWLEKDASKLVKELERADKVIGFNNIGFDNEILSAYVSNVHELLDEKSFDILIDIHQLLGFRISLDNLGLATLGKSKLATAEDAMEWWRQGQVEKVVEYCQVDVELTRDIYRYGQEHGFIYYPRLGQPVELPVDWGIGK
jgi:DEAD/DEAH box helicase domain-containing protein